MISTIETMEQLSELAKRHPNVDWSTYGDVSVKEDHDFLLFSYTNAAQYKNNWNFFETVSRGLIIDKCTGEIIARPFDKFFNWGESGRKGTGHIVNVTEKMDGSLGILYWRDGYKIATRGSFNSDQAVWATQYLNKNFNLSRLPRDITLLFEIIYKENRIIVDYGGKEDLILLAGRNRLTGEYLPFFPRLVMLADFFGFTLPQVTPFNNVADIIEKTGQIDLSQEGWVVEMSDGTRWKLKGDRYIEMHRLVSGLTMNRALEAFRFNKVDELTSIVPDEFLADFKLWIVQIQIAYSAKRKLAQSYHDLAAEKLGPAVLRKDYAIWMNKYCPKSLLPYMFLIFDGAEEKLRDLILRNLQIESTTKEDQHGEDQTQQKDKTA